MLLPISVALLLANVPSHTTGTKPASCTADEKRANKLSPDLEKLLKRSAGVYRSRADREKHPAARQTVLIAACNAAYLDMLLNWSCQMKEFQLKYFVFSMDQQLHDDLTKRRIGSFFNDRVVGVPKESAEWGTSQFNKITCRKIDAMLQVISAGYDALFSDVDIAFLQDPIPHFDTACDFHFQLNVGAVHPKGQYTFDPHYYLKIGQDRGEDGWEANTGLIFIRSNKHTIEFMADVLASCMEPDNELDDQFNFAKVVHEWHTKGMVRVGVGVAAGSIDQQEQGREKLTMCSLDPLLFPTGGLAYGGHSSALNPAFISAQHAQSKHSVGIHANWLKGGKQNKIIALKTAGSWFLGDDLQCRVGG
jgi:hypothetical protein